MALASVLGGCSLIQDQLAPGRTTINGVPADVEMLADPRAGARRETEFLVALQERAGLEGLDQKAFHEAEWHLMVLAGVRVIDGQCDQYLAALFRFNREQRAARQGLTATAAATGAILGLAGVASTAIGITAAAFGLTSSLFEASVNSVLFTIEPSALRNVVLEGRTKYLAGIRNVRVTSRPAAVILLQGYLAQCTPAAIEANINNAANGSVNAVTIPDVDWGPNPALLAAPGTQLTFGSQVVPVLPPPGGTTVQPFGPGPSPGPGPNPVPRPGGQAEPRPAPRLDPALMRVQRTLGVAPTGTPDRATASAIREFERGMQERPDTPNRAAWSATGSLAGITAETLIPIPPAASPEFQTPFERAFLGRLASTATTARLTSADPGRLQTLWAVLAPGEPDPPGDQLWPAIRQRLRVKRADGKSVLDSALWAAIKPPTLQ